MAGKIRWDERVTNNSKKIVRHRAGGRHGLDGVGRGGHGPWPTAGGHASSKAAMCLSVQSICGFTTVETTSLLWGATCSWQAWPQGGCRLMGFSDCQTGTYCCLPVCMRCCVTHSGLHGPVSQLSDAVGYSEAVINFSAAGGADGHPWRRGEALC